MTLKLFNKIKKLIDEILLKLNEDFNFTLTDEDKTIIYYNIYLTSYGIRRGTFIDNFGNYKQINIIMTKTKNIDGYYNYFKKLFNKIKKIKNLDFAIGAFYDSSFFKDTIYIYHQPSYNKIKKSMKYLNNRLKLTKPINTINDTLHGHIANLLGYDKVKYKDAYNNKTSLSINFMFNNFYIMSYQTYKKNLITNYEKLQNINNLPLFTGNNRKFYLLIEDDGL